MPNSDPDQIVGDTTRQAIGALRGYAYQIYATAVAWLELDGQSQLHVEVAEDYAVATRSALQAVQVRDTPDSIISLGGVKITQFLDSVIRLKLDNPERKVSARYLTTGTIGPEKRTELRVGDEPALAYWRRAASGADIAPLRSALGAAGLSVESHAYLAALDDGTFRSEVLRCVHWDCGRPPLGSLKLELEQLLIPFGWDFGGVPPSEAKLLAGPIIEHVLLTCTDSGSRRLSRADLLTLAESLMRVSIMRSALEARPAPAEARHDIGRSRLVAEGDLVMPDLLARRPKLTEAINCIVLDRGAAFVIGGSGSGKTIAARLAARAAGSDWAILDLRQLGAAASATRLLDAVAALPGLSRGGMIIDDLNELDDPSVARALAMLLQALRRRDLLCIATLYNRPGSRALIETGTTATQYLEVPPLSRNEVEGIVSDAGGVDPRWGPVVYRRSEGGPPQLVQAVVAGLGQRGWLDDELSLLIQPGGVSEDIRRERDTTRGLLISSVPESSRSLLYRLSLAIAKFDRAAAIKLGSIEPRIANAGEALDFLIGPWVDQVGADRFRVSPLLSDAGNAVLTAEESKSVHAALAEALMTAPEIAIDEISSAYVHGIAGSSASGLYAFAQCVIRSDPDLRRDLAKYLPALRMTRTDQLIFPAQPRVAVLLRLAQLIVVLQTGSDEEIAKVWDAIWRERGSAETLAGPVKFEAMILTTLLISGIRI